MILFLTPGDPEGIGPEIAWKTFRSREVRGLLRQGVRVVAVGAQDALAKVGARTAVIDHVGDLKRIPAGSLPLIAAPLRADTPARSLPGFQAGWSIERAVNEVKKNPKRHALVTGPISKSRFQNGGFPFPGHTEFLGHLNRSPKNRPPIMMLANAEMRVVLATIHQSLRSVPATLSKEGILRIAREVVHYLKIQERVDRPKVAILGLNPHAGEGGVFGDEEKKIIAPAVRALQRPGKNSPSVAGPFPADTFFAQQMQLPRSQRYHAVIAMYHDQGLTPIKLIDFDRTVNVTLGLNFIRTSVDHGTAFDIAGKNKANPASMISACLWAARLLGHSVEKRK